MPNAILEFNTGRPYTPEGQLITAIEVNKWDPQDWFDDGRPNDSAVVFHDHSRQIIGKIMMGQLIESDIMYMYDKGHYTNISETEFNKALEN